MGLIGPLRLFPGRHAEPTKPMPWTPDQATQHTKRASTKKLQRQWSATANSVYERTGDEGRAIRGANSVVGKHDSHRKRQALAHQAETDSNSAGGSSPGSAPSNDQQPSDDSGEM